MSPNRDGTVTLGGQGMQPIIGAFERLPDHDLEFRGDFDRTIVFQSDRAFAPTIDPCFTAPDVVESGYPEVRRGWSMYDEKPTTWSEVIAPCPEPVQDMAHWLRRLIRAEFPDLVEGIHGGPKVAMALYGVGGQDRIALGIQPGPRFVKLFIHDPEYLPDTTFKLEGSGKHMRHIKFATPPEETRDELVRLMRVPVERRS